MLLPIQTAYRKRIILKNSLPSLRSFSTWLAKPTIISGPVDSSYVATQIMDLKVNVVHKPMIWLRSFFWTVLQWWKIAWTNLYKTKEKTAQLHIATVTNHKRKYQGLEWFTNWCSSLSHLNGSKLNLHKKLNSLHWSLINFLFSSSVPLKFLGWIMIPPL